MTYQDLFDFFGDADSARKVMTIYISRPSALYNLERIQTHEEHAARDIAELEALVDALKEYRRDLARRYAELALLPYTFRLYLERQKSWQTKKVTYTVRIARVYQDGAEVDERREVFAGTDRKQAFALFNAIRQQRPGIETVQDTEKRRWEK